MSQTQNPLKELIKAEMDSAIPDGLLPIKNYSLLKLCFSDKKYRRNSKMGTGMKRTTLIFLPLFMISFLIWALRAPSFNAQEIHSWPSYRNAMTRISSHAIPSSIKNNPRWQQLESLYTKYILENPSYTHAPRIPLIIHQIWLDNPFPEEYKPLQQTVINQHPNWHYKLWTNEDLEHFKLENQDAFDRATNPGERADIWRYEILYRYGGLYLDCDFQCLKPFTIFHHMCDFYAGTDYYTREPLIYNGLIGTTPGNPILRKCIDTLKAKSEDYEGLKLFFDIHKRTGPAHLTVNFFREINNYEGRAVIFPATFFYAWPSLDRDNNEYDHIISYARPETHAIHHWGVSWLGGKLPTS